MRLISAESGVQVPASPPNNRYNWKYLGHHLQLTVATVYLQFGEVPFVFLVQRKCGYYHLHIQVPADLVDVLGQRDISVSLETKSRHVAKRSPG
jgi:hypothetical protein